MIILRILQLHNSLKKLQKLDHIFFYGKIDMIIIMILMAIGNWVHRQKWA